MHPWLMAAVLAAKANGVALLDGVWNDFKDTEGFEVEAVQGRMMGFDGKTLIHPSQVEPCNEVFAPSEDEIEHSRKVIAAFNEAQAEGRGVVTVDVSDIRHYPVFVRTPTAPPPARANVSSLWSAARNDSVTCVSSLCFADQQPNGGYVPQFAEGAAFASGGAVTIAGVARDLVPLSNFYSTAKLDNADSLAGPPDATYDVEIDNGFVLAAQAPGSVPLTLFTKIYSPTHVDTAAFASAEGAAWAQANGYAATGTAGFVLTEAAAAKVWRR